MNTDSFEARFSIFQQTVAKANRLNKSAVFHALSAAGITEVHVTFDGEGDSGQIQEVLARRGADTVELPTAPVTVQRCSFGTGELTPCETPLPEAVAELCYGYLEQEHGGWENNDGAFGEFTLDVAERHIAMQFNARFSDYATSIHAF